MTDRITYEAEPIPPRDPGDGKRWSAIFGAAAVIAVLLVGVAFGATLFRGSEEPDPVAEPTTPVDVPTTLGSPFSDQSVRSQSPYGEDGAESRPYRPGGDVGTPTPPLPAQEFTWEKVTLDLPAGDEAYLQGVYALEDGFIAIGVSWAEVTGQRLMVWKSADGLAWEQTDLIGDFSNADVWNVVFSDHGGIAFGEQFDGPDGGEDSAFRPYDPVRLVWTSRDGVTWTRTQLDLNAADNEEVWINGGLAGPSGFLVFGQRSTSPEFEPIIIEKGGYRLELSDYSYTYRVLDASGATVAEGSMEEIYAGQHDEDGQVITHPDTGEVLTVIPWETWERAWDTAYSESGSGPFGGHEYTPAVITIEFDGYRIVIDEESNTYRIEHVATGDVIASGGAEYLWRGPAPVITDDAGNEILSFSWEEFDAAQRAHWEGEEFREGYEYTQSVFVALSTDGVTWTEGVVESDASELSFDSVVARDSGYLALGSQHDDRFGGGPVVWTSTDGLRWQHAADMPGGLYVWNVETTPDGTLIAFGDGAQGQALWASDDGIAWGQVFGPRIPEDRTLIEWLNQFGTGRLGTVVVGNREQYYYGEENPAPPITLTQGDYTLTYDDYDWPPTVTVVDDETGDVVIDVRLKMEGGLPAGFSYEDGVTYIENNGSVLMAITDQEWSAAQEKRGRAMEETTVYAPAQPTMYFSTDLESWTEVPLDFGGWFGHIAVGDEAVVLAGEEFYDEPRLLEPETEYGEGYVYEPQPPVLLIGRP